MKKQANPSLHEQGSVIVWILIGVVLFAALSVAMNQGSRTGVAKISEDQARLAATEILTYAGHMRGAVQQLKVNSCEDTQISFQSAETGIHYQNTSAPSDNSCHVFHIDGGGMRYILPDTSAFDTPRYVGFDSNHCIDKIGTTPVSCDASGVDLVMSIYNLQLEVCLKINDSLGIENPSGAPPTGASSHVTPTGGNAHKGIFGPAGTNNLGSATTQLSGKAAGCYKDDAGFSANYYIFYQVLLAR